MLGGELFAADENPLQAAEAVRILVYEEIEQRGGKPQRVNTRGADEIAQHAREKMVSFDQYQKFRR